MRNDIFLKQIGKKIKTVRKSKNLTVRMLGAMCGLDYSNVSRIENGQKDSHILTLKNIAEKLEVDVKDFI